ncbi:hypothetical protein GBO17_15370 [Mycobacterium avium subsp. hominissuis]|uniref:hypothetical protein n=1 Tax=Mycobacterium avium TaxID=1764 RepID=UPI001CC33C4F|nr:hypothetical protein [Mycobacterium avium]MBZ4560284.1 hypothetical protein [Mycobacterium avium subsp. hominissuis]MBZ4569841.1 hypothetical protein [Mycobacterium avium subsp. hominissuis]MBZ4589566.1 hypothetical protein [Mycobacterium avium subsp. hominissuis]MBZ4625736.1 hypothetical protein [Mycobacterium avium subsp. hominissuis]
MTTDRPGQPRRELPKNLADHNLVFIDDDDDDDDWDGEDFDDDGDCAFCLGREAGRRGESEDQNPYPPTDARPGSAEWCETDYGLWLVGHSFGSPKSPDQS